MESDKRIQNTIASGNWDVDYKIDISTRPQMSRPFLCEYII